MDFFQNGYQTESHPMENIHQSTSHFKTPKNDLIKLQRKSLKTITRLPKSTPNHIIDKLININRNSQVPKNINELYYQQGKICKIHKCKMNDRHIIEQDFRLSYEEFMEIIEGKIRKHKAVKVIKQLEQFITELNKTKEE